MVPIYSNLLGKCFSFSCNFLLSYDVFIYISACGPICITSTSFSLALISYSCVTSVVNKLEHILLRYSCTSLLLLRTVYVTFSSIRKQMSFVFVWKSLLLVTSTYLSYSSVRVCTWVKTHDSENTFVFICTMGSLFWRDWKRIAQNWTQ